MGTIIQESLVCDVCQKAISGSSTYEIGTLSVRKKGARGRGRNFELVLHARCREELVKSANKA